MCQGSLARIAAIVAEAGANIDEVHHQRGFTMLSVQSVEIELVIQTRGGEHTQACTRRIERRRFPFAGAVMEYDRMNRYTASGSGSTFRDRRPNGRIDVAWRSTAIVTANFVRPTWLY